jgi:hypothetical protein
MTEENGALSKDDILDIIEAPDAEETLDLSKEVKEGEEPKEEDELKEIEEELEEPAEEDLELMTPARRRDILKDFPDLFKKYPYLEKAYYREQKFTEIFPTIPDAESARDKAETLDNFESKVMESGDIGMVLSAIRQDNPETFHRIVDNLLPALQKADEPAYYHVLGNVIKSTIMHMVQESQNLGENGEPLKAAAAILNQFVFGTQQFARPESLAKPKNREGEEKDNEIKTREQALLTKQYESTVGELQTKVDNTLKATIDGNIDPKNTMSGYVRKNAVRDAFDSLEELIGQDSRFKSLLDKLWERAMHDGFNEESKQRIRSAYLSKAKTLLPTVIKKARNEALKDSSNRKEESSPRKGPITPGRSASSSSGKSETKEVPKGMKTLDFLMQD